MKERLEELKQKLLSLSERDCWCDDENYNACEYSGGNYDDAYSNGREDGYALLSREILEDLFGEDE